MTILSDILSDSKESGWPTYTRETADCNYPLVVWMDGLSDYEAEAESLDATNNCFAEELDGERHPSTPQLVLSSMQNIVYAAAMIIGFLHLIPLQNLHRQKILHFFSK